MLAYERDRNVVFALFPGEKLADQIALAGSALEMELNATQLGMVSVSGSAVSGVLMGSEGGG